EHWIVVRDLRSGYTRHRVPTGTTSPAGEIGSGEATKIVVKPDGAVAWITQTVPFPKAEVHIDDNAGYRLIATGPDIAPRFLTLTGSTIHWIQAGQPTSAILH